MCANLGTRGWRASLQKEIREFELKVNWMNPHVVCPDSQKGQLCPVVHEAQHSQLVEGDDCLRVLVRSHLQHCLHFGCLNIRKTSDYWSVSRGLWPRCWRASRAGFRRSSWGHLVFFGLEKGRLRCDLITVTLKKEQQSKVCNSKDSRPMPWNVSFWTWTLTQHH